MRSEDALIESEGVGGTGGPDRQLESRAFRGGNAHGETLVDGVSP